MLRLAILVWALVVGSVVAAKADDRMVEVPAACHISADAMTNVHVVMCDGDVACTQRIVNLVCNGGGK